MLKNDGIDKKELQEMQMESEISSGRRVPAGRGAKLPPPVQRVQLQVGRTMSSTGADGRAMPGISNQRGGEENYVQL